MAYISNAQNTLTFGQRFEEFRTRMAEATAKRKTYTRTVSELSNLSNRELADLGIYRSEIKSIAFESAYGA